MRLAESLSVQRLTSNKNNNTHLIEIMVGVPNLVKVSLYTHLSWPIPTPTGRRQLGHRRWVDGNS
jgi:hypothetical protein